MSPAHDELEILADWLAHFPKTGPRVLLGPGDDAAALSPAPGKVLVATTDALVEGVHFVRKVFPASAVGHKALAVNLSDVAAMGARPRWLLCSLVLPGDVGGRWLSGAARGMAKLCGVEGVRLVGGNISDGPRLELHLTLLGEARPDDLLRRSGARLGDSLWVSGSLGDAALGLSALKGRGTPPTRPNLLQRRQLRPQARTMLGRALGEKRLASACIDISDGLALDLRRLCEASGVGARVVLDRLPRSRAAKTALARVKDPWAAPVCGGEDYELLFTVPPSRAKKFQAWAKSSGETVTCIGEITRRAQLHFVAPDGSAYRPPSEGHRHHRTPSIRPSN